MISLPSFWTTSPDFLPTTDLQRRGLCLLFKPVAYALLDVVVTSLSELTQMTKSLLSRNDLEHAALLQIRSCYGCEDVTGVIIDEIADPRFETNWTILSLRRTNDIQLRLTAELHTIRAIDGTQERLRKLYNLQVN